MLGLGDRLDHRPSELSGGQQQRVALARALVSRPEVVFADEPTGNLDSRSGAEVLPFLRDSVRELGQTVVMVTHDPGAAAYADRVVLLADGRVAGEIDRPDQRVGHRGAAATWRRSDEGACCAPSSAAWPGGPARLLLTGLAVLVASFVVFATVLAQQITERTMLDGLSGTPAAVDLVVGGGHASTTGELAQIRDAARRGRGGGPGRRRRRQVGEGYLNLSADPGTGPLAPVRVVAGPVPVGAGRDRGHPAHRRPAWALPVGTTSDAPAGRDGKLTTPVDAHRDRRGRRRATTPAAHAYAPQPPCPR